MPRAATTADPFNAVGDRTRRRLLRALASREATVSELVERIGCDQPLVSKHLRVLREVDLVRARTDGRRRVYRLNPAGLTPLQSWLDELAEAANAHFDRLDDYLHALQKPNSHQKD